MWEVLKSMFQPSNSLRKVPMYSLRSKLAAWSKSGDLPSYGYLPSVIQFPPEFWERVTQISRHTAEDGHERAVTVWWADKEFVVTESFRGETSKVLLPQQVLSVKYDPIPGSKYAYRYIYVNKDVYSKKSILISDMAKIKKVEISFLFNMHTHPVHVDPATGQRSYAMFSSIDIKGFLTSTPVITGLVTDKLWILLKTNRSAKTFEGEDWLAITPEMLTKDVGLKVYKAEFGKGAVVQCPELGMEVVS